MSIEDDFPRLAQTGYRVTSPASDVYNCLAWAAGDDQRWWEPSPEDYWPEQAPQEYTVVAVVRAYETLGFSACPEAILEAGFERIAIYGNSQGPTHVARQLNNGKWTSKLGEGEDIEHDTLAGLEGSVYGSVVNIMKKPENIRS